MQKCLKRLFVTLLGTMAFSMTLFAGPSAEAQVGGVSVTPTRVILGSRDRSFQVTVLNRTNEETTYRVFFTQRRMTEEGTLEVIEDPQLGDKFADKLVRYSPRQVTVPANDTQTVRLLKRLPPDLPEGEYRSHLVFQAIPPENVGESLEETVDDGEIRIQMVPIYGVSIPVFVRHGDVASTASLSDLKLVSAGAAQQPALRLRMNRDGNKTVIGTLKALHISPGGDETVLGEAKGVSLYAPNATRQAIVPFNLMEGQRPSGGLIRVAFHDMEQDDKVIATAEMPVN